MNILRLALILFATAGLCPLTAERLITDMAGRKVRIPDHLQRVYGMSPTATILLYTLSPDRLVGWNYQAEPAEKAFLEERFRALPVIGGWFGRSNTGNLEEIVKSHPDAMLSMGDPAADKIADRVQQQTGIPVIVLNGELTSSPATYRFAGNLLETPGRAAELADYCQRVLHEVATMVKTIPAGRRRRYFYAEGPKGLETEPGTSWHCETLNFAGGVNVASIPSQPGYGHTNVSMEQLLRWNPDLIITGYERGANSGVYRTIRQDTVWSLLGAVKRGEVFEAPQYPFNWIDRPPSVNRIIGVRWLANLFYPEVFHDDMRAETQRFYRLFYRHELPSKELDGLLGTALRGARP